MAVTVVLGDPVLVIVKTPDMSSNVDGIWIVDERGTVSAFGPEAVDVPAEILALSDRLR